MRILTVRQPWALHIIQSTKDVENRPRNIVGSYRGAVAIHAGLQMDDEAMRRLPMHAPDGVPRHFWTGVIIGVVDIMDVHHADSCQDFADLSRDQEYHSYTRLPIAESRHCSPWALPDNWHISLARPRRILTPIPYKGALGLRELPDDVAARVLVGVRADA